MGNYFFHNRTFVLTSISCFFAFLFCVFFAVPVDAYSNLDCKQQVQGEHAQYKNISESFSDVQLCVYDTGYSGSLSDIKVDKQQGVILPKDPSRVKDVYLYFSGKGGGSPADNCVGPSKLCQHVSRKGDIAIVLFNRAANQNNMLPTAQSMRFFFDESRQVMRELGIQSTQYHLAGHSAGGKQVWWASQFLSDITFGYSLIFDGCYGNWCDELAKQTNRGYTIMYLNTGELKTAQSVIDAAPGNMKIYDIPTKIAHGQVPFACFRDHFTDDKCGAQQETKAVYENGGPPGPDPHQEKTIATIKDEISELLRKPTPQVEVPGLSFTPLSAVADSVSTDGGNNFYILIPYLSEYVGALFRYGIGAVIIIAIAVIIVAGVMWTMSAGNSSAVSNAKTLLARAIIGLIIALGSYTILAFINPKLTELEPLSVLYVSEEGLPAPGDEESFYGQPNANLDLSGEEPKLPDGDYCFPLQQGSLQKVSWNWGDRRSSGQRCHVGIDIYTKAPGKVVAIADGIVTFSKAGFLTCKDGWGVKSEGRKNGVTSQILIFHEELGITINYGEVDSNKVQVKAGDRVTKGQVLGVASYCGMLHFEVYDGRQTRNIRWLPNSTIREKNGCAKNHLNKKNDNILNPTGIVNQLLPSSCQ